MENPHFCGSPLWWRCSAESQQTGDAMWRETENFAFWLLRLCESLGFSYLCAPFGFWSSDTWPWEQPALFGWFTWAFLAAGWSWTVRLSQVIWTQAIWRLPTSLREFFAWNYCSIRSSQNSTLRFSGRIIMLEWTKNKDSGFGRLTGYNKLLTRIQCCLLQYLPKQYYIYVDCLEV